MCRAVAFSFVLALCAAAPASAQLWFFPNVPVPTGGADLSGAFIGIDVSQGINEESEQVTAFGGSLGLTGETTGLRVGAAVLDFDRDEPEVTVGAAVGFDLLDGESSGQISVEGGVGWFDEEFSTGTFKSLRFPIGVALKLKTRDDADGRTTLWVMPRFEVVRLTQTNRVTLSHTDLGASAGFSSERPNGFGFHSAIDVLFPEESDEIPLIVSAGLTYRFGV